MKRVVIVRHAKSVPYGYDDDFHRDLKEPRGYNDAKKVSEELRNYDVLPDLIISSPAKRALKTARIFAETFEFPEKKIQLLEDLYDGISTHELVELLNGLENNLNSVFIFGHNPTIYYLIKGLAPRFNEDIPTSSSVSIEFKCDNWKELTSGSGTVAFQLMPRTFK
ncbi:MAG: histidine phosphatase family protein [Prolixibacteraceae bacterium]|nr:histidine phosphatase family protein [Prolixibacteraceae bacterium]MBN2775111.1 histidine phosphatase family protein [Prolixibacteraceae bacterium]